MTETMIRAATVAASALLTAVTHATNAVSKKPTMPVMTGLRLSTRAGRLQVTGYDWELRITREVPIDGTIKDVLVPAITLQRAVKNLDQKQDVELTVTESEGALVLTQGRRVITLGGLPMEELPELPEPTTERSFALTQSSVKFLAEKVLPFSGKDDMLPVLSRTVQFDVVGSTLTAGSTDRFRAALAEIPVFLVNGDEFHILVPDLQRFAAAFDDPEQLVTVGVHKDRPAGGDWVTFQSEDTTVTIREVEGSFPRLASLFPSESTLDTEFDPVELSKAVKFVSLAIERNCAVEVDIEGDHITVTGGAEDDKTRMTDTVTAALSGRDADLAFFTGFNPDFVVDVLKVFGKGKVTMHNTASHKPALFTSDDVPGLRVLLMPRRLAHREQAAA